MTTNGAGIALFNATVPGNIGVLTATSTSQTTTLPTVFNTCEFSPAFFTHAVYGGMAGPAAMNGIAWTSAFCGLGTSGTASFDPGSPAPGHVVYFVVVGQTAASEGSYGRDGAGAERPEAVGVGASDVGQSLTASCDPPLNGPVSRF